MATSATTIWVVDHDATHRRTFIDLLSSLGVCVRTYHTAQAFLAEFDPHQPGCVITQLLLPHQSGLDVARHVAAHPVSPPVLVMTDHGDVATVARAMREGVFDFIAMPLRISDVLSSVNDALRFDQTRRVFAQRRSDAAQRFASLHPREREVVDMIMVGLGNKQIAARLGLTLKAIEARRSRIREKLGVDCVVDLVQLVLLAQGHLSTTYAGPIIKAA